jgi:hypothetical protein
MKPVSASQVLQDLLDRRTEPRQLATGEVLLTPEGVHAPVISGRLLDLSDSGFRAAHDYPLFDSGTLVAFFHSEASGIARVIWNRNMNGEWESGFHLLKSAPH